MSRIQTKKLVSFFLFALTLASMMSWRLTGQYYHRKGTDPDKVSAWEKKEVYTKQGNPVIRYKNSYALIIGGWKYDHWDNLDRANFESEIKDIEDSLVKHGFKVIKVVNPTSQEMRDAIDDFKLEYGLDPENRVLFFFSGHGYMKGYRGFIVPKDAPLPELGIKKFLKKALSYENLVAFAKNLEVKHALFLFDSCFSGSIFYTTKGEEGESSPVSEEMGNPVRKFITAGKAKEVVPERSVFIPAFVNGIDGKADYTKDGYVTGEELFIYIKGYVKKQTKKQNPRKGTIDLPDPDVKEEGDFIFILDKKLKEDLAVMQENYRNLLVEIAGTKFSEEEKIRKLEYFLFSNNKEIPGEEDDRIRADANAKIDRYNDMIKESEARYDLAKKEYDMGNFEKAGSDISSALKIRVVEKYTLLNELIEKELNDKKANVVPAGQDQNLPPSRYRNKLISKRPNKKGFWEVDFAGHVMVYIPSSEDGKMGGFFVDKYEVSYAQFIKVMKDNRKKSAVPLLRKMTGEHPAIVFNQEARLYCQLTGFRLLNEAEWEFVAGSKQGHIYSWGNDKVDADGTYRANYNSFQDGNDDIAEVKSYEKYASPYGIVNLSGNVWEWVQEGICKGGGYLSEIGDLKIKEHSIGETCVGFRCVKEVEK